MKKESRVLRLIASLLLLSILVGNLMLIDGSTWFYSMLEGNLVAILQLVSTLLYIGLLVCLWLPSVWSQERRLKRLMIGSVVLSATLQIANFLNNWYLMVSVYKINVNDMKSTILNAAFSYHGLVPHLFMSTALLLMISLLFDEKHKS